MANRRASIWKYVRVGTNWRYCKPAYSANNKIKPDFVLVNGSPEHHPEGAYYLRFSANGGSWKKIGPKAADAVRAAEYEESVLTAKAVGIPIKEEKTPPMLLSPSLWGFLEEYRLSQRPESYNLMKQTLEEFAAFVKKQALADIERIDLLRYKDWLMTRPASEGKQNSMRTAANKMLRVNQYLRAVQGIDAGKGLVTVKDGRFVETEPEVFTPRELEAFFAECNQFQLFVFKTYLMSGLRKQELENLEWGDVNFESSTLHVSAKPGWEERTIEIPRELLERFVWARREAVLRFDPDRVVRLVFANRNGHKYTHSWDDCQDIAEKAHVAAHPHKFRATYATTLLQRGIDLKTVQMLLGHKNLESTMRYLAKAQSAEVRAKLDAVWAGDPV